MHIVRTTSKTFCGRAWSVWRKGFDERPNSKGIVKKVPLAIEPLPTDTFEKANCGLCRRSFISTAGIMSKLGTIESFFKTGQQPPEGYQSVNKSAQRIKNPTISMHDLNKLRTHLQEELDSDGIGATTAVPTLHYGETVVLTIGNCEINLEPDGKFWVTDSK